MCYLQKKGMRICLILMNKQQINIMLVCELNLSAVPNQVVRLFKTYWYLVGERICGHTSDLYHIYLSYFL